MALLIGSELSSETVSLNRQLRDSTLDYARQKLGKAIPTYTPWTCFAPIVATIPHELLFQKYPDGGPLIKDEATLVVMADFIGGDGKGAIAEMPGDPALWIPNGNDTSDVYEEAVSRIRSASPIMKTLFDEIVEFVVPLGGGRNRGYSSHYARGAIFRSLPAEDNACDVAFDVVHEIGHQVLMIWQSVDPILDSDHSAEIYSQIRKRNRPAIQSFHATVALAYMTHLQNATADDPDMQDAANRRGVSYDSTLQNSLSLAIKSIDDGCTPTALGHVLLDEMRELAG